SWGRPMSRFTRAARCRVSGQHDVGHEGVITGRDAFSLRSSIANPQGVAQPPLQSTLYIASIFLKGTLIYSYKIRLQQFCEKAKH
ncbi:hypothetical protein, partial [Lysinibacillus sp. NPDC093688]|uniref:hypothetical protein n=1 Tax=Lysinibacillus sp. NPDC093688 TaxID=3390577 RepID=UPI003D0235CB